MKARTTGTYLLLALAAIGTVVLLAFRGVCSEAVYPVENASLAFRTRVWTRIAGLFRASSAQAENVRLRREVASLALARGDVERLEAENARLRENVYQAIVTVLCECHRKLSVVGCWEICDKVLTYLEHLSAETGSSEVEIPFRTSSEFAQYLGVNRCALSRSVSQLIRSGKLKRVDGRYVLPAAR